MKYLFALIIVSLFTSCSNAGKDKDHTLLSNCLDQDLRNLGNDSAFLNYGTELSSSGKKDGYKEFGTGFILLANKDSVKAQRTFRELLVQKHTLWLGYCGLGLTAWKAKHYTLARAAYDSALLKSESHAELWYLKGLNEAELDTSGRYSEAIRCFEAAGKLDPEHYYAWYMAGLHQYMGDSTSRGLKKAIPFMEKAIIVDSKNPDAYIFLADNYDSYHEQLRYTQLAIDAGHIPSIKKMAELRLEFGDYEKALSYYNEYLKHVKNNPEDHIAKASCLMSMGKFEEALEALSYARALDPSAEGNHIHYRKSLIFFDQQKYAEALNEINIVLAQDSFEQTEYYVHKARVLVAMKQLPQAKQVLDQYLKAAAETDADVSTAENMRAFYFGE